MMLRLTKLKKILGIFLSVGLISQSFAIGPPDEGMYPLSELKKLDLKKAGLKIDQSEVYNPNGISLIDALVNVGGCTGSFVSEKGLIITNHHCAFGAVQLASTPENDYLTNGFVARTFEEEIPAKGLTCRITDSYEDVSTQILDAVKGENDPGKRINLIHSKIAELVKAEEEKDKTIKAEVSEMFIGRTYVLFRYKTIQDVRLVYIPQRAIGEFGGESDNWVWPRHTGDFSFVRAYVAKDGSSATYSKDNVPYTPKKILKINPAGVEDEDFVFILGYPGRTFRNYPSQYIEYQEKFMLPYISSLYEWQNAQMEASSVNKESELKQASRIKSKANVQKNYKGKLKGLKAIDLVERKRLEEKAIQEFIDADAALKEKYGSLLTNIALVYDEIFKDAKADLVLTQTIPSTNSLRAASLIISLRKKIEDADASNREKVYNEGKSAVLRSGTAVYESYVLESDKRLLKKILLDGLNLIHDNQQIKIIPGFDYTNTKNYEQAVDKYVEYLFAKTKFKDPFFFDGLLAKPLNDFMKFSDPMLDLAQSTLQVLDTFNAIKKIRDGKLNTLLADYVDIKMLYSQSDFIPDANRTLRLTYGYIRGYSPSDATYMKPITTLSGLIEKGEGSGDYYMPPVIRELYKQKKLGKYRTRDGKNVPVALLYNMDTTGGNSGSPIMNENGELVGVNFDRAYEATINDFAWNESYSRSIGVDIRFILWVAQEVDKADFILKELGVK